MNIQTTWQAASPDAILPEDEIHVWRGNLDQELSITNDLDADLSEDERARAIKFYFARDRNRFIVARGLLRRILAAYLRQEPAELQFCYGPQGKPSLQMSGTRFPAIHFNLAHANGQVVYAFASSRQVGIDLEPIRDDFPTIEIAKRFFSSQEINQLLELPSGERREAFFLGWTRKEAYIKARGEGLRIELDSFAVSLAPSREARFLQGVEADWHLVSFSSEGSPAALVHDGTKCSVRYFSAPFLGLGRSKLESQG
jgi:4'-phosphopantetheinyl transferase